MAGMGSVGIGCFPLAGSVPRRLGVVSRDSYDVASPAWMELVLPGEFACNGPIHGKRKGGCAGGWRCVGFGARGGVEGWGRVGKGDGGGGAARARVLSPASAGLLLQVVLVYVGSVTAKLSGAPWRELMALGIIFRAHFATPLAQEIARHARVT